MTAMPQPASDDSEPSSNAAASDPAPGTPPPHLLWATLESAYAEPEQNPRAPREERLGAYFALPIAVGLSLVLWVIIVELVLMR